jgi:hypothetical protein
VLLTVVITGLSRPTPGTCTPQVNGHHGLLRYTFQADSAKYLAPSAGIPGSGMISGDACAIVLDSFGRQSVGRQFGGFVALALALPWP